MRAFLGIVLILFWGTLCSSARAELTVIDQASLIVGGLEQEVSLPHRLDKSAFGPQGSTVTYRIFLDAPPDPEALMAIYISKVGLSARLFSNGQLVWTCAPGNLAERRCLHQPHLIPVPAAYLTEGQNEFEFEVYADKRQANGLAPVIFGPFDEVFAEHYLLARLLKVDLLRALGIFAGVTGLLSLAVGFAGSRERIYYIFATAAIFEALAVFLMSAIDPPGDRAMASWLIFSVRYVGVLLKLLLLYEAFGRLNLRDPVVASFVLLILLGPTAIGVTDSDLWVVLLLYSLVGIGMFATVVRLVRWTFAAPSPRNMVWTATAIIIFAASLHDYLRLGGAAAFDGVYLLYYVFPLSIILMGSMLFSQMGKGLRVARDFNRALSQEVSERTSALESALASIRSMESSALSLTRNIPIGTFILQTWGQTRARFAFFSDRLREMINWPPDVEPPLLIRGGKLLHPDDVDPVCEALFRAFDDVSRFEAEFRIRNATGDWRWLHCIMLPQPGSASPVVWDGVVIDVTDAREAEERLLIANTALVNAAADQSRTAERERMLREMHDGFGSQLSSARLAIEQGYLSPDAVARILLECSQDLRIMIDTLGNEDGDLNNAVADFRYRTDRLLSGTSVTTTWDVDIPEQTRLSPTVILHILRVLQEAKNNALRHSGGQNLKFVLKVADGWLSASVSDDGSGIQHTSREGRGMANMRKRCREIGARLQVRALGEGTQVLLEMELSDAQ